MEKCIAQSIGRQQPAVINLNREDHLVTGSKRRASPQPQNKAAIPRNDLKLHNLPQIFTAGNHTPYVVAFVSSRSTAFYRTVLRPEEKVHLPAGITTPGRRYSDISQSRIKEGVSPFYTADKIGRASCRERV